MTTVEWLDQVNWLPVWMVGVGLSFMMVYYNSTSAIARSFGTALGGSTVCFGLALLTFSVWGEQGLLVLIPVSVVVSLIALRASEFGGLVAFGMAVLVNLWTVLLILLYTVPA